MWKIRKANDCLEIWHLMWIATCFSLSGCFLSIVINWKLYTSMLLFTSEIALLMLWSLQGHRELWMYKINYTSGPCPASRLNTCICGYMGSWKRVNSGYQYSTCPCVFKYVFESPMGSHCIWVLFCVYVKNVSLLNYADSMYTIENIPYS